MRNSYLFAEQASMNDVIEHQKQRVQEALNALSSQVVAARPLDEIVAEFVERFRIDVPVLGRNGIVQFPNEEIDIDVSQDPMRGFMDRSQPFYITPRSSGYNVPNRNRNRRSQPMFYSGQSRGSSWDPSRNPVSLSFYVSL